MAKKKHFFAENKDGHKTVHDTEGGACLTGHHTARHKDFKNKSSCNFRYQALQQASTHGDIKAKLHSYNDKLSQIQASGNDIDSSAYQTNNGELCPAYYTIKIPVPGKNDWNVGGPDQELKRPGKKPIETGKNFTMATWPYWNNAHHLIPKGTLKSAIVDEGAEVGLLMEKCLLSAKYNINHKRNMLLMPMDKEVAKILDMPRHLLLKENDDSRLSSRCTSHPDYDEMVQSRIKKIIKKYREIILNAIKENCDEPDFDLDKKTLEALSDDLLEDILESPGGQSLDSLYTKK